jgi:hypothetical protein
MIPLKKILLYLYLSNMKRLTVSVHNGCCGTYSCFSFLQVRWDDIEASRHNRFSPWEIEPSGSASSNLMAASLKRTRIGITSGKLEFPVPSKLVK